MKNEEPVIHDLPARRVASLSYTGNYIGDSALFGRLFTQLGNWAASEGLITPQTVFLSCYPNDPRNTPLDELRLDVCMSLPDGADVVDNDIHEEILPGGPYAVMRAELTRAEEFETAWNAVVQWAQNNNHALDMSRPSYEVYLNNPDDHPQKHHIVDIYLSVNVYA